LKYLDGFSKCAQTYNEITDYTVGAKLFRVDRGTDGWMDMKKLIVASSQFSERASNQSVNAV